MTQYVYLCNRKREMYICVREGGVGKKDREKDRQIETGRQKQTDIQGKASQHFMYASGVIDSTI